MRFFALVAFLILVSGCAPAAPNAAKPWQRVDGCEWKPDRWKLLVANGLARIYGTKTSLPDGRDSRAYITRLTELEGQAKRERKGGWRFDGH